MSQRGRAPGRGRGRGGDRGGFQRGGASGDRGGRGRGGYGGPSQPPQRGGGPRGGYRGTGGRGRGGSPQIYAAEVSPRIDAQRITASEAAVVKYAKVPYEAENPLRPGFGTLGTQVVLRANFFAVKVPKAPIFEYSIEITPKADIRRLRSRILQLIEESPQFKSHLGYIAHDQSERLISARQLPQPLDISIVFYEEGMSGPHENAQTFVVSITFKSQLDVAGLHRYLEGNVANRREDPLPVISALNLVLQQHARRTGFRVGLNRDFFTPSENERLSLSQGVEAWKGFYSSVRPTFGQLTVNVNVCMSAFYVSGNLADAILGFRRQSKGGLPNRFVQKLKIRTKHLGHKKNVKEIMSTSARRTKFHDSTAGRKVTVEDYFKRAYPNFPLQHADDLPVVDVGVGDRQVFVPAELCDIIEGTPYLGRLDGRETSQMIRYACNPPAVNATSIVEEGFVKLGLNPVGSRSPLSGFGIEISNEMMAIPGRVLPSPTLTYKTRRPNVRDGSWNILDVEFQHAATLFPYWAILIVRDVGFRAFQSEDNGAPLLNRLIKEFSAKLKKAGITMPRSDPRIIWSDPLPGINQDAGRRQAVNLLKAALEKSIDPARKPSFVLVLLSLEDNYIYPGIKRLGDVDLGIQTICMILNEKKALVEDEKKRDQYYSNVALKVNMKLGGINHLIDPSEMRWLRERRTMMVGCDVTHPGPGSLPGTPSIAAVVASVDNNFVQFPASMRLQGFGKTREAKEMIDDMAEMMIERLKNYEKVSKSLPEKVIIFRDGVSEGQFDLVLRYELPEVKKAFQEVYGKKPHPLLSIIICGKRHHARPIPTSVDTATHNGNTRPGTVVDKGITDVYRFDFYLQAHAGLQGTARPTHYTVVYDENRLSADTIQQGTHTASYSYARATKAVSLVPAAYYADLVCDRGRFYINDFLNLAEGQKIKGRPKLDKEEERRNNYDQARTAWGKGVHEDLRESMFYI